MGGVVALSWRGGTVHGFPFVVLVLLQVERDGSLIVVDPRVLFIPSYPGLTGLTVVCDRSDRCMPLVGFASSELLDSCVFESWCFWSVLGLFGVVLLGFV
jgi:hypothetical protein